ncbi:MAG: hypothetical protein FWC50_04130 [Planctomycetaceae bacterium]|nr:hypothetical protein [Planctomycetaceae bacterium]
MRTTKSRFSHEACFLRIALDCNKNDFCLFMVVPRRAILFTNLHSMLISANATDIVYQKVLELLVQYGVNTNDAIQQTVLLNNDHFIGYRFCSMSVRVDWLAQQGILVGKNERDETIFEQKIEPSGNSKLATPQSVIQQPVAA